MKKLLLTLLTLVLILCLSACGTESADDNIIKVSATPSPHAEILEEAKEILEEEYGYTLEIEVLTDYYVFNRALEDEEVDANYFQHLPYLENDLEKYGYDIVNAGEIHIEPFGFFSKTIQSIDELKENDTIVISNSISDHGRILTILSDAGVITLDSSVTSVDATTQDIIDNPLNLEFVEIKPELLASAYENEEGALVAINGNYALQAGLNPVEDAVLLEDVSSDNPYVNVVACKSKDKDSDKIKALVEVLKSDAIKEFINEKYQGSVIVIE